MRCGIGGGGPRTNSYQTSAPFLASTSLSYALHTSPPPPQHFSILCTVHFPTSSTTQPPTPAIPFPTKMPSCLISHTFKFIQSLPSSNNSAPISAIRSFRPLSHSSQITKKWSTFSSHRQHTGHPHNPPHIHTQSILSCNAPADHDLNIIDFFLS